MKALLHALLDQLPVRCTIVGRDRAEDAVQQTLVNVHTSLISSHDPPRDLQAWMLSIARNASLNLLRGEREVAVLTDRDPAREDERPDLVAERTEWLRSTFSAVAALPEAQRDAIVLRELQGCSHEEIAAALGVTTGAARQHLFRARAALRAGVTAITPQPLLIRLIEWGSSPDAMGMTTQLGNVLVRAENAKLSLKATDLDLEINEATAASVEQAGATIDFWRVRMKPGKPVMIGRLGDAIVLGLPGNPTSAMVTARLFLLPLLARLHGQAMADVLRWRALPLASPLPATGSRETFTRARLDDGGLTPLGNQDSGAQGALAEADWLIRCPSGQPERAAGDLVSALPF